MASGFEADQSLSLSALRARAPPRDKSFAHLARLSGKMERGIALPRDLIKAFRYRKFHRNPVPIDALRTDFKHPPAAVALAGLPIRGTVCYFPPPFARPERLACRPAEPDRLHSREEGNWNLPAPVLFEESVPGGERKDRRGRGPGGDDRQAHRAGGQRQVHRPNAATDKTVWWER